MKKFGILMIAIVTAASFTFIDSAFAGRLKDRQLRQQKRIHQGIRSGELTGREVRALEREQYHIQRSKRRAWSDGELSGRERLRLEHQQDRASWHIYRLKHNDIDRN